MNSISNLPSVGNMLNFPQASLAGFGGLGGLGGLGVVGGGLGAQLRAGGGGGGRMSAGSGGSSMSGGLRLSQLSQTGTTTDSLSQQQQQQAAALRYPLSFQNPLFHLAADGPQLQRQPSRAQVPPPLLLAPGPDSSHPAYLPQFARGAFSRSEDLSTLRPGSHLAQPSIVHSHSYSDDYTRHGQEYGRRQTSMHMQVVPRFFLAHLHLAVASFSHREEPNE